MELRTDATYILNVELDPSRCEKRTTVPHDTAGEGEEVRTKWMLEVRSDGEVVLGNDTMELDLEALVLRDWAADAGVALEERKEAALLSREKWLEEGAEGEFNALFLAGLDPEPDLTETDARQWIDQKYRHSLRKEGHVNRKMLHFLSETLERERTAEVTSDVGPTVLDLEKHMAAMEEPLREQRERDEQQWATYRERCQTMVQQNAELFENIKERFAARDFAAFPCEEERENLIKFIDVRIQKRDALAALLKTEPVLEDIPPTEEGGEAIVRYLDEDGLNEALAAAEEAEVEGGLTCPASCTRMFLFAFSGYCSSPKAGRDVGMIWKSRIVRARLLGGGQERG